jgi:hypothetical protein
MQLKPLYCYLLHVLGAAVFPLIAERRIVHVMFIEDIIRNTINEVEVNFNGLFVEEVNRKFFLALRYWVTFTLPAVVSRHTVYRRRPLCPRVPGWNRLVLSVTYFGCARHMTGRHRVTAKFGLYKPPSLPAQCRASAVAIFRHLNLGSEITLA